MSHTFIEGLIGTICREYLDHMRFWSESDLEQKKEVFKKYANGYWIHESLNQQTLEEAGGKDPPVHAAHNNVI